MGIKGKEGNGTQGGTAVPLASEVRRGTACVINIISYTCTYLHNKKYRKVHSLFSCKEINAKH